MQNTPVQRIVYNRCRFSCQNSGANAVKIVAETNSSPVEDIYFIDCIFENISRMGFEVQCHADNTMRYRRIHLIRCRFKATGLMYQGQAISFTGFTVSCNTMYCTFDDAANIPLEYVRGGVGCNIIGNEWINCTRGTYIFLMGQSSSMDRWRHCVIRDNRTIVQSAAPASTDDQTGLVLIANTDNSVFSGNHWRTSNYVEFRDCANNEIFGDWYDGRGSYGLLVSSGSTRNQFHGLQARSDRSSTAFAAIRFHGSGTTLNELFTGRARKGTSGAEVDEASGAVGNILHLPFNIADTLPSAEADVTLSASTYSMPFHWSQRKAFLYSGSPAATVTVTFPPYGHFAFHQNSTGQSVIVKPSSGTGPTLAAGEKALVFGSVSAWAKATLA